MSYTESYTADVQAIAIAQAHGLSGAAYDSEASLRKLHRHLPEVVEFSVHYLGQSGVDVGASKATSHRLTESLMREMAVAPQGRLTDIEQREISVSAARSVLVQEAAANEFESRTGQMDIFRQFMGDKSQVNGARAMTKLDAQGVDTVALYGQATNEELRQMSVGAFDRTSPAQQERTAKAMRTNIDHLYDRSSSIDAESVQRSVAERPLPVRTNVVRFPGPSARRPAVEFGRRISPGMVNSMAGRSI